MRVGSLFSGIGGLDLGLERAGMKVAWQVEKDPYCQKVLKKHWPEVPCYGDIKEIDFTTLPPVDLICGGFPCQPWSVAGKRKGIDDERNLWPETFKCIWETKARWVLLENVPGILTHEYFGRIIGDLASLGHIVEWHCLQAAAFGAPHLRERVFILAYPKGRRRVEVNNGICSQREYKTSFKGYSEVWGYLPAIHLPAIGNTYPGMARYSRVDHGLSAPMDRLKCLGNAVVPQVAEWIGKRIMEAM